MKTGEQGEAAKLEDARGLGDAAWVEEAGGEGKAAGHYACKACQSKVGGIEF